MNGCKECIVYQIRHNMCEGEECPGCGKKTLVWKQSEFGTPHIECKGHSTSTFNESEKTDIEMSNAGTETSIETGIEISLTETEKRIVGVIRNNPAITISDIAKRLGMSRSGAQYVMDSLKKRAVLKREGATKRGRWVILDSAGKPLL